jgi:gas vesicle protein
MKSSLIFLAGLGLGTVLGILIAPDPGPVTRQRIKEEADRIVDRAILKKKIKQEVEMASDHGRDY